MLNLHQLLAVIALAALIALACGEDPEEELASDVSNSPTATAIVPSPALAASPTRSTDTPAAIPAAPTRWVPPLGPDSIGWSVENMLLWHDTVITGRVVELAETRAVRSELDEQLGLPGYTLLIWHVEVTRVLFGNAAEEGSVLRVSTVGDVPDNVVDAGSEEPLEVGQDYLLFLRDWRPDSDAFSGMSFGRFEINDDGLVVPNGGEGLDAVAEITGLSWEEYDSFRLDPDVEAQLAARARNSVDTVAELVQAAEANLPSTR